MQGPGGESAEQVYSDRYKVRLFGAFTIIGPDGLDITPHGRKAQALFACLLLTDGNILSREKLAVLLWGDRGEEQARASLRQALHDIRNVASGAASLVIVDRAQVRIATTNLVSDIDRLRYCREREDAGGFADTIGDHPHDLLSGFDGINECFDEWLAGERFRRGDERRRSALILAERTLVGNPATARRLALALLAADPTDEAAARIAMEALYHGGDRDGVRRIFQRLETTLRRDLETGPSDETVSTWRRLMNAPPVTLLPEIGLLAPPHAGASDDIDAGGDVGQSDHAGTSIAVSTLSGALDADRSMRTARTPRSGAQGVVRRVALATGASLLLGAGALLWWQGGDGDKRALLVNPLQVSAGDRDATALRDGLSTDLARMIVGSDATLSVVDPDDQPSAPPSNAAYMVTGEASTSAGTVRATVRLLGRRRDAILWSDSFSRGSGQIDALRQEIASKVADVTTCALGGQYPRPTGLSLETLRLYLAACEEKHGDYLRSAFLLRQVVARAPRFAHAWAMLGASTAITAESDADRRRGDDYALRALAIDPRDDEAYFARVAAIGTDEPSWWARRKAMLDAGLAIEPDSGSLARKMALELMYVGRWKEAIQTARRAIHLDPFAPVTVFALTWMLATSGHAQEAEPILASARQRFPADRPLSLVSLDVAARVGDPKSAASVLTDLSAANLITAGQASIWAAMIKARAEPSAASSADALRLMTARLPGATGDDLWDFLQHFIVLNRIDAAYAIADRIGQDPDPPLDYLFTDFMAPFRADPRFMTLAAREGLIRIWRETGHWPDFCGDPSLPYDCRVEARRAVSHNPRPLVPVAQKMVRA